MIIFELQEYINEIDNMGCAPFEFLNICHIKWTMKEFDKENFELEKQNYSNDNVIIIKSNNLQKYNCCIIYTDLNKKQFVNLMKRAIKMKAFL